MLKIPHDGIYGKPNFAHSSTRKSSKRKLFFPFFLSLKPHKIYYTNKIDDSVFLYTSQYKLLFAHRIDGNPEQICKATSRRAFSLPSPWLSNTLESFREYSSKNREIFVKFLTTPKEMINKILITSRLKRVRSLPPTRIPMELIMQTWAKWNPLNVERYVQK